MDSQLPASPHLASQGRLWLLGRVGRLSFTDKALHDPSLHHFLSQFFTNHRLLWRLLLEFPAGCSIGSWLQHCPPPPAAQALGIFTATSLRLPPANTHCFLPDPRLLSSQVSLRAPAQGCGEPWYPRGGAPDPACKMEQSANKESNVPATLSQRKSEFTLQCRARLSLCLCTLKC